MILQKPTFEVIAPDFGHSFTYQKFDEQKVNNNTVWHYHPEIELVFINGGSGKRQIFKIFSKYAKAELPFMEKQKGKLEKK